jgi:hypothetical protein
MNLRILTAIALTVVAGTNVAKAESLVQDLSNQEQTLVDPANSPEATNDRLLIVNGSSGHVIYDDGKDDLFCVTRKVIVGYNQWGYPIRKRSMRCR